MTHGGGKVRLRVSSGHVRGQLENVSAFITGPAMKHAPSVPFSYGQLGPFMRSERTREQPFPALPARFSKLTAAVFKQGFRRPELVKVGFRGHVRAFCCM
jgi:hypothetical protein